MAHFDLPLSELREYRPEIATPTDLAQFWARTLDETRSFPLNAALEPIENGYALVDSYDVTFSGFGGHRIKGWLHVPAGTAHPLPTVVEYLGYSRGRGLVHQHVEFALAGYAHFTMDTRGQGWGGSTGDTSDPTPDAGQRSAPGQMTRGILDPDTYYYRRVFADAVRAVEAARSFALVDSDRVVVTGISQGGGIAIAAAALTEGLLGAAVDVPFLCHFERAVTITDQDPYFEIVRYLRRNRGDVEQAHRTLSYFDGAALAPLATAPTLFSVALMDAICPPSTVFAAYNHWGGGSTRIEVYPFNEHEGGQEHHHVAKSAWLRELFDA
ncbi:MAG: axeA [Microbacteriaceae bacterium]|nr:axeA [Microbacteriaceae bacterium]HEV7956671.1 acetylxylan esterase [Marisediminicola sp.]